MGAGHVARSAALAAALPGGVHLFLDPGAPPPALAHYDFDVEADTHSAALLCAALGKRVDCAIIDSPDIADSEIVAVARKGWTAVFRDGAPRGAERLAIDLSPGAVDDERRLGGPSWAPLAAHFAAAHERAIRNEPAGRDPIRILVAFGARDSVNRTGLVVEALSAYAQPFVATVVLGAAFAERAAVEAAAGLDGRLSIVTDTPEMSTLYLSHDVAIGAPGVSQYERACCGLPTVLVAQNEGQKALATGWATMGCAIAADATPRAVLAGLDNLAGGGERLEAMRNAALRAVDGRGASRLATALAARAADARQP
ncbi:MAG: hypothetical protein ACM3N5_04475 [Candidatus Eiseniibacteriota bacterium]